MYASLILLFVITVLYAGYNLFIKVSSSVVPVAATSTILATITLQVAALAISSVFAIGLLLRGNQILTLSVSAYTWAAVAGLCIGAAEIGYFYLFRGVFNSEPMSANIAIPCIVGGTILVTVIVSWLALQEPFSWSKLLGAALIVSGVIVTFVPGSSSKVWG